MDATLAFWFLFFFALGLDCWTSSRLRRLEQRFETLVKAHADLAARFRKLEPSVLDAELRAAASERQEIADRGRKLAALRKAVERSFEEEGL